jgi:hypothetical protein
MSWDLESHALHVEPFAYLTYRKVHVGKVNTARVRRLIHVKAETRKLSQPRDPSTNPISASHWERSKDSPSVTEGQTNTTQATIPSADYAFCGNDWQRYSKRRISPAYGAPPTAFTEGSRHFAVNLM